LCQSQREEKTKLRVTTLSERNKSKKKLGER
jgi:hypothetical protein